MSEEEPLDSHVIELADTRPVMLSIPFMGFLGEIPMNAAVLISAVAGLSFNFFGWKYGLWHPFAWYLIAQLIKNNYHGLTHAQKWLETGGIFCLDRKAQGGVSAAPFPQIKSKARGIA